MKFEVQHDPIRQRVLVYCRLPDNRDGDKVYMTRGGDGHASEVRTVSYGHEPPLWDWFPWEVAEALGEVLAPRPEFSERFLEDALTVRDRLLALVEAQQLLGQNPDDLGARHIGLEADNRRFPAREMKR
jgi:hypothetical protein